MSIKQWRSWSFDKERIRCSCMVADKYMLALHRYFIWADRMRVHFNGVLKSHFLGAIKPEFGSAEYINATLYMSYWYAGMYVVIEGWKELGLSDSKIDKLLNSTNVDLLKRYRNGVFHFQKKYWDERFIEFIRDGENAIEWIRQLREEFSRFFLEKLDKKE